MNRSVSFSDNLLCSSSENNTARLTQGDSAELQQSLLSDRNLNNNKLKIKIYPLLKTWRPGLPIIKNNEILEILEKIISVQRWGGSEIRSYTSPYLFDQIAFADPNELWVAKGWDDLGSSDES